MTVTLDHTIVHASDNLASAQFLADILGVARPGAPTHFTPVVTDNDVVLDFMTVGKVLPHHYAFTMTSAGSTRPMSACALELSRSMRDQIAAARERSTGERGNEASISMTPTRT
jgi:hypothetical protein